MFSFFFRKLFNDEPKNKKDLVSLIKKSKRNSLIDQYTFDTIERVIGISKRVIKEVMIPKPNIVSLELNFTLNKCLNIIIDSAHSRFPVMSRDKNYIEGFLIVKDLLPFMKNPKKDFFVKNILRPAVIVPESKSVKEMLKEFKSKRFHMAVVIDEFGVVSGLITIEDILELIVGEIYDEYDFKEEDDISKINDSSYFIKGFTPIKVFNKKFRTTFKSVEVDTIAGFITKKIERLPKEGETLDFNDFQIKVLKISNSHIVKMQLFLQPKKMN